MGIAIRSVGIVIRNLRIAIYSVGIAIRNLGMAIYTVRMPICDLGMPIPGLTIATPASGIRLSAPQRGLSPAALRSIRGVHGWASWVARASISFSLASRSGRNFSRSSGNQRFCGSR